MKTQKILLTAIMAFAATVITSNADTFTNGGSDNQYDNPANWSGGVVPTTTTAEIDNYTVTFSGTETIANTGVLAIGYNHATTTLNVTGGGTLQYGGTSLVGQYGGTGTLNISDGAVDTGALDIAIQGSGLAATGTVNVGSSGTLAVAGNLDIADASSGVAQNGSLNVNGGTVTVSSGWLLMGTGATNASNVATLSLSANSSLNTPETYLGYLGQTAGINNINLTITNGVFNTAYLGTLVLGGVGVTNNLNLTLNGTANGALNNIGDTINLLSYTSVSGTNNFLQVGQNYTYNGMTLQLDQTAGSGAGDYYLEVIAVPEPSTVALAIIFGAGILLLFRRRSNGDADR